MCTSDGSLYPLLASLVPTILGSLHATRLVALTDLVWALLAVQSLHPADLARGLPHLQTGRARQAQRRVRRILGRVCLGSVVLTPLLVRAVLRLVRDEEIILVLDWTRCLTWDIFTLGVRFHGRVLPVAWECVPYPWPKHCFTPHILTLLDRTMAAWPTDRAVHLVADRGFPSLKLFRCLEKWRKTRPLGYTIRLRASDYLRLADNVAVRLGDLEQRVATGHWATAAASYQHRNKTAPPALLVMGKGIPLLPPHQMGPADQARRVAREARRLAHLASKGQPAAAQTDRVWALLTTRTTWLTAVSTYTQRFATEGMYRDWKEWDLAAVVAHETDLTHLDSLVGLAALGYLIQAAIGAVAGRTSDWEARARQQQWSTTERLSIFWRGRQVLHDRAHDWRPWLKDVLPTLLTILTGPALAQTRSSPPCTVAKEAA